VSDRPKPVRCAIYTRKSSEHNLDLEFNSLHAQREACEAYIKSQMHEGWQLIPDNYDDGGISGASLDRPDLQRLLGDISAGRVDTVVVYKVDRLTRSLADFAKLVELFDKYGVSFVSVTQAFNTTTSMGRLTLNVLLSFAQFEREVTGERIRDKVAASKKKGLFMGGNIPLGYINQNKKLVIVPEEAERVRWIFQRYLELGSIDRLLEEMNSLGIRTKVQILSSGRKRGGVAFGKGPVAHILKNRCYVGEIVHRGAIHAAEHEPIIPKEIFDAVQESLAAHAIARTTTPRPSDFLLTGLLFDSAGNRMTPSHSRKKGIRYRYYVSQAVLQSRKADAGQVFRVPAPDIEALVEQFIRDRCRDADGSPRTLVEAQIAKITVQPDIISVELAAPRGVAGGELGPDRQFINLPWSKMSFRADEGVLSTPSPLPLAPETAPKLRERVLRAVAKARLWVDALMAGGSLTEIARQEGKTERHIQTLISLAFVPPPSLQSLIYGTAAPLPITEFANLMPLVWADRIASPPVTIASRRKAVMGAQRDLDWSGRNRSTGETPSAKASS
jgi:site-specific DNA recombinase